MASMRESAQFEPDAEALRAFAAALAGPANLSGPASGAHGHGDAVEAGLALARGMGGPRSRLDLARVYCEVLRHNRRAALSEATAGEGATMTAAQFAASHALLRQRPAQDARIRAALSELALEQREILAMTALAGFSHTETAQALELPLTAVVARLAKAREALGALLAESSGAAPYAPEAARRGAHLRLIK